MAEMKKVPEIRFKGFNNEWSKDLLGELSDVYDGTHQTPKYTNSGVMFLSVENIQTLKSDKYISKEAFENEFKTFPQSGDVLMTRIGDIGTANVVDTNVPIAYYVSLALLKQKKLHPYFLKHSISTQTVVNDLWRRTLHIAFPKKINKNEITKVEIPYPIEDEQTKIGSYFQRLDKLISLHQTKVNKLTNLKKAMLEKMFPKQGADVPEIRFKGFAGAWEEKRLGDVVECYSGGTPLVEQTEFYGGDIPFIRSAEINSNSTELYLTEKGLKNSSAKLVKTGDILYALYGATSGEVGRSRINGAINQAILAIIPSANYDAEFIMQLLRKLKLKIIGTFLQGGQGNLSGAIIKDLNILFPLLSEQQKIGAYFQNLDKTITLHQTELEKLNNLKKACLEKMFV